MAQTADNKLAIKLKELRLAHGCSQADLVAVLDIKQQTYSQYETGKRLPSSRILYKIARYYGISADDLLTLSVKLDEELYYDTPAPSRTGAEMSDYLAFFKQKKLRSLSAKEKELLYLFSRLTPSDKEELIDYARFKAER